MILEGKTPSDAIKERVKLEIAKQQGRPPSLAVVLVGDDPASAIYVGRKVKACRDVGILSKKISLPATVSEEALLGTVITLREDPSVDAILVQLPLPPHINSDCIINAIGPKKDVDGLHPENQGRLYLNQKGPSPCTPLGIIELLKWYKIPIQGKHAVVVGRSSIVGKPMAALLLNHDACVTVVHRKVHDPSKYTRDADILIAGIGQPHAIGKEWIKPGAVVIDVGISRVDGNIVGDVDYKHVKPIVQAITPVPGGVGPMTIAMLLCNTLACHSSF